MLEEILSRENITLAYKRVVTNKGCAGVDGLGVTQLKPMGFQSVGKRESSIKGRFLPINGKAYKRANRGALVKIW